MPVITIDLWPVSHEQRIELIQKLTKTASEITKLPPQAFFVYVREYPKDAIGVSGTPLSQQFPDAGTQPK
ncbi:MULTISPECIES: 4-oxalocrotonate tautomerase DmpI [unclassified Methanoregula]|uniref:4-oxalocrotonate tautomerase DmpI n=1 Tax=unclassified Methanoregula TaxID=2649730 RepID=UPI0009CE395F|nr:MULTISPECIES: 4-oxalocrotonate tautomerase DmpI [unclassified Methanoregula]OPX62391.1 MAG: Tautomerase enzyme [Methanoregula sp. PtaB.Bin085]OPY37254.1 MAG: Tautomerase enzyme [Methanoregula sp. PtaU1.Bin006]